MTSRVDQENAARQAEAERLNKRVEKDARDTKAQTVSRDAFSRLVKQQDGQGDAQAKGAKKEAEGKQGDQTAQKSAQEGSAAVRAALSARGGVIHQSKVQEQARSFQGLLTNQQAATQESDQGLVKRRDEGKTKDRIEKEDRTEDVRKQDAKKEVEGEQQRVEARTGGAGGSGAVDPDGKRDDRNNKGEQQQGGAPQAAAQAAAAKGPAAAHEVKQIPPELLEKLCSAVYLAVNDKGLREFQIELKDGPLKGALVKITAEDGKVALRFENLGADEKRLVEASKGELMRRLEKKGLSLSRLDVK